MKKLIVAFYGNPGGSSDFDEVLTGVEDKETHVLIYQRPTQGVGIDALANDVEKQVASAGAESIIVVAYSWGCYLACHWLSWTALPVNKVVFVSPTVVAESPIPTAVYYLANMPVLGNVLLGKASVTKTEEFIEKSFAPLTPTTEQYAALNQQLKAPHIWKEALFYKYQQQQTALTGTGELDGEKLIIFRGGDDVAITWETQEKALRTVIQHWDKVRVSTLDGYGHALLWGVADPIREAILAS